MRFTSAAFLAFAASVFAQTSGFDALTTPTQDESIPAGQAYTINWQPGTYTTGTVTLSLLGGATPSTLLDLGSFASGIQNSVGTYTWTVDSSLGDAATYGIKITLDSDSTIFQYSFPFHITASAAATTTTTSSSSAVVVTTATGYPTSAPVVESSTVVTYSAVEITSSAAPTTVVVSTSAAATATVSTIVSSSISVSSSVSSSASTFATVAPSGNGTYTASTTYGATTLTSATTKGSSSTSSSATATASVVTTNGAGRAAAGSFALVAAVAAAFLL